MAQKASRKWRQEVTWHFRLVPACINVAQDLSKLSSLCVNLQ
jgi:hypothetical protein